MDLLKRLWLEEDAQDLIEYGLLLGLITIGTISAMKLIGPKVNSYFGSTNTNLP
ncbi:MAG: hypothetical protein JOZ43_09510 [Acidobacteriales bacterium]|nr:hypothetical protein [Terriglobales bacterium]